MIVKPAVRGWTGVRRVALVALVGTALSTPARANEFPSTFNLSAIDGVNGLRLDGALDSFSGLAVTGIGDVNGDGIGDMALGAEYSASDTGLVYVVFGRSTPFTSPLQLSALNGSDGFTIVGEAAGDLTGQSVAAAGDVNGDGIADILIGAWRASPDGVASGKAYVVFGSAAGLPSRLALSTLNGANGFRLEGTGANTAFGLAVDGAGDINGDGFDDVMVGAYRAPGAVGYEGAAFVVFGSAAVFPASIRVTNLNGGDGFRLSGVSTDDRTGYAVAGVGDINGDGHDDIAVGAPRADNGGSGTGSTYVVFGSASAFASNIDLSSLAGSNGFRIDGAASSQYSGGALAGRCDINGDGISDLALGVGDADFGGSNRGSSYVVFGSTSAFASSLNLASLSASGPIRFDGVANGDQSGGAVACGGDVNGDGFDDFAIGAYSADNSGVSSGSAYVVFGQAAAFSTINQLSALDGTNGFRLDGEAASDVAGIGVGLVGDFNHDGLDDPLTGALGSQHNGVDSGSTYAFFGRVPDAIVTRVGSAASQYMTGGAFADSLQGLDGNDTLEGRELGDALDGGNGMDTASYAHSAAPVVARLALASANSGDAQGDSYTSIENLEGSPFADGLYGDAAANRLFGNDGDDTLKGDAGNDRLTGGKGKDNLYGGKGRDTFVYLTVFDSPKGTGRDRIRDFKPGKAKTREDQIDLSAIDAKTTTAGNQKFRFIGSKHFSRSAGEVRVYHSGGNAIIAADTDGNGTADLEIQLDGVSNLSKIDTGDFRL